MTQRWRDVPGETKLEQAVRLAGALAECGVQEVVLKADGLERRLGSRETDLPGVLESAQDDSVLEVPSCGVEVEVAADALRWRVTDPLRAEVLTRALA